MNAKPITLLRLRRARLDHLRELLATASPSFDVGTMKLKLRRLSDELDYQIRCARCGRKET